MNKTAAVVGVLVLAGAAYVGTSWYVGQQAEIRIREGVEQANERVVKLLGQSSGDKSAQIQITDYKRGLFSSDAIYTLIVRDAENVPSEIKFSDHLQHGPFPLSALKAGHFAPVLAHSRARLLPAPAIQPWFDSQQGDSPVIADTRIGFGGTGTSVWTFAPIDYAKGMDELRFSGGDITIDFSNNFADSTAHGRFDTLSIFSADEQTRLNVQGAVLDSENTSSDQETRLKSTASFDSFEIVGEDGFKIEKLTAQLNSEQRGPMLAGTIHYSFGRLLAGEADLGGLELGLNVKQIDTVAVSQLVDTYDAIRKQHGVTPDEELQLTEQEQQQLIEKLMVVLASKPMVSADPVVWKNTAGQSTARVALDLEAPAPGMDTADPIGAITQMLHKVQLDLDVSRAMFVQAFAQLQGGADDTGMQEMGGMLFDQYVDRYEQAGLLRREGDSARLNLVYQDDKITFNGTQMSLQSFMMLLMMSSIQ